MTTKCYILEESVELLNVLNKIFFRIPIFVNCKAMEGDFVEYTFIVRNEDVSYLERSIARYV